MKPCETQRGDTILSAGRLRRMTLGIVGLSILGVVTAGCSDFRRAIGTEKSAPDEFEVVVRPPLSLPPAFAASAADLSDGASTELATSATTDAASRAATIFGANEGSASDGYGQIFNFAAVPDNIRQTIDEETYGIRFERRLPLEVLFGGLPNIGPVLDKVAEDQRLRQNLRDGRLPDDGATPGIDAQTNEPVSVGD